MKKYLIGAAGGVLVLAIAPALAQVAPAQTPRAAAQVHTRAHVQAKIAQHFTRIDVNRDGFVTKAEAEAVRGQGRAKRAERRSERVANRAGKAFDRLDANNDGAISRAEFDGARAQRVARRDRNGDGRPDARAGRQMRGAHAMGLGGFGGRMFEMADANRDQRVSLQEATAAALRHFDTADANRDGQVTREERRQVRQQMQAQRRSS